MAKDANELSSTDDVEERRRLKEIFVGALDLRGQALADYLGEACNDDSQRREIELMVDAYREAGSFLEVTQAAPPAAEPSLEGRRVGPYRIDRVIGQGGMGRVYLASRCDGAYQGEVAIKTVRAGFQGQDALPRFRNERQILARLDHPHIAKLLDGGQTEDGIHYIVMEYVDGEPIDHYCDRHRLAVRERLELFRGVCDAVFQAHRSLVVHRDLKPSNILVTRDGSPKLLDFGIAKWLDPGPEAITVTAGSARPMTPGYAAPEQIRGEPITTATDVYALGVVLYELVTGVRPFRPAKHSKIPALNQLAGMICEQAPEKPSSVIFTAGDPTPETLSEVRDGDPTKLRRRLTGDVDTLILKAMSKEPERRYASAERLSDDIRRHLNELPIRARPETAAYRFAKFVRRSPLLAATGALVAWLAVGLVLLTVEVSRQRDRAEAQAARAGEVMAFTLDLFKGTDPAENRGAETTLREFLDLAAAKIPDRLRDRPEVRATILDMIGSMYLRLGEYTSSRPLLEEALSIRRDRSDTDSGDLADSMDVMADTFYSLDRFDDAEELYREAVALRREVADPELLALSLNNFGLFLADRGKLDEAEASIQESLGLMRASRPEDDPELATVKSSLASLLHRQGKLEQATELLEQVLSTNLRVLGEDQPDLSIDRHNLGQLLLESGRFTDAEPLLERAAHDAQRLLGREHPTAWALARSYSHLLHKRGKPEQARQVLVAALPPDGNSLGPKDLRSLHSRLGHLSLDLGDLERAEAHRNALVEWVKGIRESRSSTQFQHLEGRLLSALGLHAKAIHILEPLHTRRREELGDHLLVADTLMTLGRAEEAWAQAGEPAGAPDLRAVMARYRAALELRTRLLPDGHPDLAEPLMALARIHFMLGEPEPAERRSRQARELISDQLAPEAPLLLELAQLEAQLAGATQSSTWPESLAAQKGRSTAPSGPVSTPK